MLSLRLHLADAAGPWTFDGTSYIKNGSYVRPYVHAALEHFQLHDGTRTFVAVRERKSPYPFVEGGHRQSTSSSLYDELVRQALEWSLEFIAIELTAGTARLFAGSLGTAPLYLTTTGAGLLAGSWEFADMAAVTADATPVAVEIVRGLTYWDRYSQQTVLRGVQQLTERSSATFDSRGLRLTYPEPAFHSRARQLAPDADPIRGFDALLEEVIKQRYFDPKTSAVELSGGLDSAAVAVSLCQMYPDTIRSGGMIMPSAVGEQQARRRLEMISRLGLQADLTISAANWPPLHPGGTRASGKHVSPEESSFLEAQGELFRQMAEQGVQFMFNGLGGDELLSLRPGEVDRPPKWEHRHPQWLTPQALEVLETGENQIAPSSRVSEVTLLAFASIGPLYLRHGLWPIAPLADPGLITYGEWLPVEWRHRKRLQRERLRRCGFSEDVVQPVLRESFVEVMGLGLRRWGLHALDKLVPDSRLADLGIVDRGKLQAVCEATRASASVQESDYVLFHVVKMELFLRSL